MYAMRVAVIFAALTLAVGEAFASGSAGGVAVEELLNDTNYPDLVFVSVTGTKTANPGCHTHTVWEFVVDTSTQQGVLMYSMLMVSLKDGLQVDLLGNGTCTQSTEYLRRVELH